MDFRVIEFSSRQQSKSVRRNWSGFSGKQNVPTDQLLFADFAFVTFSQTLPITVDVCTQLFNGGFVNRTTDTAQFVPRQILALDFQLFDLRRISRAGSRTDTNIRPFVASFAFDIIRAVFPGFDFNDDKAFSVHRFKHNVRNDLRLHRVRNRIGDSVHNLKHFVIVNADDLLCFVVYADNQLAAVPVRKSDNRLDIVFRFCRQRDLKFQIFVFAVQIIGYRH